MTIEDVRVRVRSKLAFGAEEASIEDGSSARWRERSGRDVLGCDLFTGASR